MGKKLISALLLFLLCATAVVILNYDKITRLSLKYLGINLRTFTGELSTFKTEIESLSGSVIQTGQPQSFSYSINQSDLVIIVPPYFNIQNWALTNKIEINQIEWMEYQTMAIETGQIFLIRDKVVVDHQLLNGSISPEAMILTDSAGEILIYKDLIAERPVKLVKLK